MTIYALCSHIGNLMRGFPQTNDPDLRELLQSQIDDMIRITNHSSDLGRSHIGYLELARKALD
jgi:spore coat protein CotF